MLIPIHCSRADEQKLPEHVISGSNHSMDGRQQVSSATHDNHMISTSRQSAVSRQQAADSEQWAVASRDEKKQSQRIQVRGVQGRCASRIWDPQEPVPGKARLLLHIPALTYSSLLFPGLT